MAALFYDLNNKKKIIKEFFNEAKIPKCRWNGPKHLNYRIKEEEERKR